MHSVICGLISLFGHICIGSIAVGLGRPGEAHGTKRNRPGAHGISGEVGRPAVPSTWRRQPPLTHSDLTGHARGMYDRKG
jgi:hypothetical protein